MLFSMCFCVQVMFNDLHSYYLKDTLSDPWLLYQDFLSNQAPLSARRGFQKILRAKDLNLSESWLKSSLTQGQMRYHVADTLHIETAQIKLQAKSLSRWPVSSNTSQILSVGQRVHCTRNQDLTRVIRQGSDASKDQNRQLACSSHQRTLFSSSISVPRVQRNSQKTSNGITKGM